MIAGLLARPFVRKLENLIDNPRGQIVCAVVNPAPGPSGRDIRKELQKRLWLHNKRPHLVSIAIDTRSVGPNPASPPDPAHVRNVWLQQVWKDVFGIVSPLEEKEISNLLHCQVLMGREHFFICAFNDDDDWLNFPGRATIIRNLVEVRVKINELDDKIQVRFVIFSQGHFFDNP